MATVHCIQKSILQKSVLNFDERSKSANIKDTRDPKKTYIFLVSRTDFFAELRTNFMHTGMFV